MSNGTDRRTPLMRAAAAQRLALDGPLQPVTDLNGLAGASPNALVRWIREGRSGVHLDGVRDRARGWCSSPEAVRRFLREWAERRKPVPGCPSGER